MAIYRNAITDATATTVANLITAIESLLSSAGWTQEVSGSPNVWSTVNNGSKKAYFALEEDSEGNLGITVGSRLNSGGTAISTDSFYAQRSMNFATGDDWTCYVYSENVILYRDSGFADDSYFASFGVLNWNAQQLAAVTKLGSLIAWAPAYVMGTRAFDSAVAEEVYLLRDGENNGFWFIPAWGGFQNNSAFWGSLSMWIHGDTTFPTATFREIETWGDGALITDDVYVWIGATNRMESCVSGCHGIMPNMLKVTRKDDTDLNAGDTVTDEVSSYVYDYGHLIAVNYLNEGTDQYLLWLYSD